MELQAIIDAYFVARKNKRKSPDQVEFELHWERNCINLWQAVQDRNVRPTAYTFVATHPRPREVFASDMATRILHHYIDMRLRPHLERRMGAHTYNNRVGMGTNACQNAVISDIYEVSKGFTEDAWIIKLDMSGCFPNIRQDIAYKQLEQVILEDYHGTDKYDLIYILQVCVFSYPTLHCYRKGSITNWADIPPEKSLFNKPLGIGGAIGHLIWQNAVNYYFHELDAWILGNGIRYERYVDDMYFVVENKTAFLAYFIPEIRKRLAELGAQLNERKFYCQYYAKGVECLGVHIKMDRVYANRRIIRRGVRKAKLFNRCVRESKIASAQSSLNSYFGICKNSNGYKQALKIVAAMSEDWKQYLVFNHHRMCLEAAEGYKENQRIIKKYKLK